MLEKTYKRMTCLTVIFANVHALNVKASVGVMSLFFFRDGVFVNKAYFQCFKS